MFAYPVLPYLLSYRAQHVVVIALGWCWRRVAAATGFFMPVSAILLEMLNWSELSKAPRGGAGQPPDMLLQLRISKTALKGTCFQQEVVLQVGGRVGGWVGATVG